MLGGRRGGGGVEGWPDRPRLIANITSPLGATNATKLIFLPPLPPLSRFTPPPPSVSLVQLLLACQSVSLPVRPFVSVGLSCGLSFSLLSTVDAFLLLCFFLSPREPLLSRIYIPVLMCPLSAVLVLAPSSTSLFSFPLSPPLSSNLSLSVSSHLFIYFLFFYPPHSLFPRAFNCAPSVHRIYS